MNDGVGATSCMDVASVGGCCCAGACAGAGAAAEVISACMWRAPRWLERVCRLPPWLLLARRAWEWRPQRAAGAGDGRNAAGVAEAGVIGAGVEAVGATGTDTPTRTWRILSRSGVAGIGGSLAGPLVYPRVPIRTPPLESLTCLALSESRWIGCSGFLAVALSYARGVGRWPLARPLPGDQHLRAEFTLQPVSPRAAVV